MKFKVIHCSGNPAFFRLQSVFRKSLGHAHNCRPDDSFPQQVSSLHDFNDVAAFNLITRLIGDRFMEIRIERVALRINTLESF